MKKAIKEAWLTGLRSGEYKQGQASLHYPKINTYCCLGVYCATTGYDIEEEKKDYKNLRRDIGEDIVRKLEIMNDHQDKRFPEIADWIEANIPTED